MVFTLEIQSGPNAGRAIDLQPSQVVQVGLESPADLVVPDDPTLSDLQFLLKAGETVCYLCDLSTHGGVFVNGALGDPGDGPPRRSDRRRTEHLPSPRALLSRRSQHRRDLRQRCRKPHSTPTPCRRCAEDLAAVGRARRLWRDPMVLALLFQAKDRWQSLYEGIEGERLAAAAPYLVQLPNGSPLLETLARDAWGHSWGVYLTCDQPFEAVRKHLRHFLLVTDEEGEELYFRYYDPRVPRVYLPTCTRQEVREFFGPIREFLMEGEDPTTLLIFGGSACHQARRGPPGGRCGERPMKIRKEQMAALDRATLKAFQDELVRHLRDFDPKHTKVLGEDGVRQVIRLGMERAAKYGLTNRGPIRLYIELMFLFGSDFDTDPWLPWAGACLSDPTIIDQMDRAEVLYEEMTTYLDAVAGPDNAYLIEALRRPTWPAPRTTRSRARTLRTSRCGA